MTWNAGGLSSCLLDSLFLRLASLRGTLDCPDIVVVVETHWRDDREWITQGWHCAHSGCPHHRWAGILVLISSRLCTPMQIRTQVLVEGRLFHVKLDGVIGAAKAGGSVASLDVVGLYQHPWDASLATSTNEARRAKVWRCLEALLSSLAMRNGLVLLGDFNSHLHHAPPFVGTGVLAPPVKDKDHQRLVDILQKFDLCMLNTFGPTKQAYTYARGRRKTQIDYIATRRCAADGLAKRAWADHAFYLAAWRLSGDHSPVHANLALRRQYRATAQPPARVDMHALANSVMQPDERIHMLRQRVSSDLPQIHSLADLDACLHRHSLAIFPARPRACRSPWLTQPVRLSCKQMWAEYRAYRHTPSDGTLRSVARVGSAWAKFQKAHKAMLQASQQIRKQRRLDDLLQLEACAHRHDARQVFAMVKKLAPKQARARTRMHHDGRLLGPGEEAKRVHQYFEGVFSSDDQVDFPPPMPYALHEPEVLEALLGLPLRKAHPPGHAPSAAWRGCADLVAPVLHGLVNRLWADSVVVPDHWQDAWLALVPKKLVVKAPDQLRPIGIQAMAIMPVILHRVLNP